jgi:uncharacterized membrane protein
MIVKCAVTGEELPKEHARQGFTIRPSIMKLIREQVPDFDKESWITAKKLREFKTQYVHNSIGEEGFKTEIGAFIAKAVAEHDFLSHTYLNTLNQEQRERTFADKVADWMGSWTFIYTFLAFVGIWGVVNVTGLSKLDPYPFQFLNLVLGVIAALSAPLIMMSQNREMKDDRARALNDFKVNLKNEFELMIIREKIDHVIHQQMPHLLETIEMLDEDVVEEKHV